MSHADVDITEQFLKAFAAGGGRAAGEEHRLERDAAAGGVIEAG